MKELVATASNLRCSLVAGFILCAIVGIFFRLFHVDWKLYSYDETVTSLRASGHTLDEFEAFVHDGKTHFVSDLRVFQAPARTMDERGVLHSLALEDPQHPPLYFVITSLFQSVMGDSVFMRRLPAVVFGLLCIPALWWFAYELFEDHLVAWCVAALTAVSPFHVEFSQQAREYSYWTMMTALSSALLLRFLRLGVGWALVAYAVSVALGLWGFALYVQVVVAQGLYLLMPLSGATARRRGAALAAAMLGVAAFFPWLAVIVKGSGTALNDTSWSATHLSTPLYIGKWIFNAGSVFFDLDYVSLLFVPIVLVILAISFSCCYRLLRTTPRRIWPYLILMGLVAALSWLGPDIIYHESRAGEARYLTVLWLSVELATGYGLVLGLCAVSRVRIMWGVASFVVLCGGIVSCSVGAFARTWWIASNEKTLPAISIALAEKSGATLVYLNDSDMLLEILPVARADLRFILHPTLNENALQSAARPYAITKPFEEQTTSVAGQLRVVPLPTFFPPVEDPAIEALHRRATGDRFKHATYQHEALYEMVPSNGESSVR